MEPLNPLLQDVSLASTLYDRIPPFETQLYDVSPAALEELGEIFVRHGVHTSWGPSLLHRHYHIPNEMSMVHRKVTVDNVEMHVCRAEKRDEELLWPSSFFLTQEHGFVPYEYHESATGPFASTLPKAFLDDLAGVLVARDLSNVLGLSWLPADQSGPWFEETWPEIFGTVATNSPCNAPTMYVATAWRVRSMHSHVIIEEVVECKKPESGGGHLRPVPPEKRLLDFLLQKLE